jgi:hypothetical protein
VHVDQLRNERVLFLTVIEQAIQDSTEHQPKLRQAAIDWLMCDQVDFPHICELAGLDSTYLRRNLVSGFLLRLLVSRQSS